jgi:hypothetical protein
MCLKCTSGKLSVHDRQTVREDYSNNIPKTGVRENLLYAGKFGFLARYTTTLQCLRLMNHVIWNFNNICFCGCGVVGFRKSMTLWLVKQIGPILTFS